MTTTTPDRATRYASPVDTAEHGEYRIVQPAGRPLYQFTGRLSADGSSGFRAEPGRYHLYAGWFCPWAQRVVLELTLNGLAGAVSVSYVDDARDGRGWAFRATHGPDPVNGFTLLRQAYEATEPGFVGHISVPTLWDRQTHRVVSNDYRTLGIDLATQFDDVRTPGPGTYPADLREEIEDLDRWIGPDVNSAVGRAAGEGPEAESARARLLTAFARLDARLAGRSTLVGPGVTTADVRLWVTLVRYDVQANATGRVGPPLSAFPELARYAAELAGLRAFSSTTRWASFSAPGASPSFLPSTATRSHP